MHRMAPDDVEFHEVGSVDAIVDVVGTCAALESLGIDRIVCSPITVGEGTVRRRPRPAAQPGAGRRPSCSPAAAPRAAASTTGVSWPPRPAWR